MRKKTVRTNELFERRYSLICFSKDMSVRQAAKENVELLFGAFYWKKVLRAVQSSVFAEQTPKHTTTLRSFFFLLLFERKSKTTQTDINQLAEYYSAEVCTRGVFVVDYSISVSTFFCLHCRTSHAVCTCREVKPNKKKKEEENGVPMARRLFLRCLTRLWLGGGGGGGQISRLSWRSGNIPSQTSSLSGNSCLAVDVSALDYLSSMPKNATLYTPTWFFGLVFNMRQW